MPRIRIEAPAKLNLHLKVGDRRPDGFHGIESLFLALAFGDTLYLETAPSEAQNSLEIRMDWQLGGLPLAIPPEKNSIARAVSLFRSRTGYDLGLKVTVEKRIPPGGGLGGGSSDAAATLLALNRLVPDNTPPVNDAALAEMGASLGSDVPFFLYNAPAAWITGRGETVQPLELPESALNLALVLVNPGFPSDTAEAYRLLDGMRKGSGEWGVGSGEERGEVSPPASALRASAPPLSGGHPRNAPVQQSLFSTPQSLFPSPHNWPFFNDFLPVFANSEQGAVYQRVIGDLREMGADFAGLSGSGSTCFGVFSGRVEAETATESLLKRWPFVILTFPLARRAISYYNIK